MKFNGLSAVLAVLIFAGCEKSPEPSASEPTPAPAPAPKTAIATPAPTAPLAAPVVTAPAAPASSAPRLAPEGVFYLLTASRVETPNGIVGLKPGTGVKRVRPGIYLTPAGEAPLADSVLTNDMDRARQARDADLAAQSALQNKMSTTAVAVSVKDATAEAAKGKAHQAALKEIDRQRIEAAVTTLQRQEKDMDAQLVALYTQRGKENYNKIYKNRNVISSTETRIQGLEAQLKAVRDQITASRQQLQNL